mmetsp:Transcript_3248/g.5108  ORF Transcript_3248/g.5108 Transcript_3248/m.5108 type:complete len:327 (-) Transcript_3248:3-983(-)
MCTLTLEHIDIIGSLVASILGMIGFLAFGVQIDGMQNIVSSVATLFGMLSPMPEEYELSLENAIGGNFALAISAINLQAFFQCYAERDGTQSARQFANLWMYIGLFLSYGKAALDRIADGFNGTLMTFWVSFFAVMALVYFRLYFSGSTSLLDDLASHIFRRAPSSRIDLFAALVLMAYSVTAFLAFALRIESIKSNMPNFLDFNGLLNPTPGPFLNVFDVLNGNSFALGMFGLNFSAWMGSAERKDVQSLRKFGNNMFWAGTILSYILYPENGSFFLTWEIISGFFIIFTLQVDDRDDDGYTDIPTLPTAVPTSVVTPQFLKSPQ